MENCSHVATGKILGIPRNSKICQFPHDNFLMIYQGWNSWEFLRKENFSHQWPLGKSQEFLEIVKYANTFDISRQLNSLEILEIEVY